LVSVRKEICCFGAANGLIYAIGAFYGGKIAQRRGYFPSLIGGWAIMVVALILAFFLRPRNRSRVTGLR
jgi:predicted MFS family arabinose efflux permease